MPDQGNFWDAWTAIATTVAVIVALFGPWLQSRFLKFKLLLVPCGEHEIQPIDSWNTETGEKLGTRKVPAFRYRVRLENLNRWLRAHNAKIMLTGVSRKLVNGEYERIWSGAIPLMWSDPLDTLGAKTLGPPAEADLCSVVKDKWLDLGIPLFYREYYRFRFRNDEPIHLLLDLCAMADEADSKPISVYVDWDLKWADSTEEMSKHFILRQKEC